MFPEAARVFFHTSKYFVPQISYSVACTLVNFSFHPPSAHSALGQKLQKKPLTFPKIIYSVQKLFHLPPHCTVLRFNFMSFARYRNKHSAAYPPQKFLIFMMNASCLVRTQFYLFAFFAHIKKEKRRKNECYQRQKLIEKEEQILIDTQ